MNEFNPFLIGLANERHGRRHDGIFLAYLIAGNTQRQDVVALAPEGDDPAQYTDKLARLCTAGQTHLTELVTEAFGLHGAGEPLLTAVTEDRPDGTAHEGALTAVHCEEKMLYGHFDSLVSMCGFLAMSNTTHRERMQQAAVQLELSTELAGKVGGRLWVPAAGQLEPLA